MTIFEIGDRQSIFRLPFKSKLNLSRFSSREDDTQITTVHQASVNPPSREKDVATLQKNENLKRMIHEKLQSENSISLPNLTDPEISRARLYQDRSVDETDQIQELNEIEFKKVERTERKQINSSEINHVSVENEIQVQEEIIQKKVKFEEVSEVEEMKIVETRVLAQIENNSRENSTDLNENYYNETLTLDMSQTQEQFKTQMPPTPMKRKSREEYFEPSDVQFAQETELPVKNGLTVDVVETPVVKPRTKRLIHRTSDVSKPDENFPRLEIGTLQEVIKLSDEKPQKLHQDEEAEVEVSQELPIVPKSILKSSETSSSPKTITFKNLPHTISDSDDYSESTSSSSSSEGESEEEDVWSRVDQHRVMLNKQKDTPPPLPKTPPPSSEEEANQFSFA